MRLYKRSYDMVTPRAAPIVREHVGGPKCMTCFNILWSHGISQDVDLGKAQYVKVFAMCGHCKFECELTWDLGSRDWPNPDEWFNEVGRRFQATRWFDPNDPLIERNFSSGGLERP